MNIISSLDIVDRDPGYDSRRNAKGLSVADLTAQEIRWCVDDVWHSRRCALGIGGMLLRDGSGLAIVEAPYKIELNRALLINFDGSTRAAINPALCRGVLSFYDVLYMHSKLNFLAVLNNDDCRIEVDESDGRVMFVVGR